MEVENIRVNQWKYVIGQRGSEIIVADGYKFHYDKGGYYRCGHSKIERDERGMRRRKRCEVRIKEIIEREEKYFVYSNGMEHKHKDKYIDKEIMKETINEIVEKREYLEKDLMVILTETYKEEWGIKRNTYLKKITERIGKEKKEKKKTEDIDMYILYEGEDFVIIGDPLITSYINLCETIYCDGTFKIAPVGMYQMYTIHGIVDGEKYSMFYCLMKNKQVETYKNVFSIINQATGGFIESKPMTIMGDFEVADFKFLKVNKTKKCCYFHYCQIIERNKVKECSEELINELMVLPLVPEERVYEMIAYLTLKYTGEGKESSEENEEMINMFIKKFVERYKINNWNVSKEEYKTNNICESYHRTINKFFKHKKLQMEDFVPKLIEYIMHRRERIRKGVNEEFGMNKRSEEKRREIQNCN